MKYDAPISTETKTKSKFKEGLINTLVNLT